ncbi:cytochrome c oxidase subunit 6a mitochondrial [Citrus sinensis]|nr:cytochrome c oxidase subunit 6a mitochondrial [Citrus sinensis]
MVRSGLLQTALRRVSSASSAPPKRGFASSAHHDDAYETAKWEKITYLGIATCTVLAFYNLSKGHPHYEEPPVRYLLFFLYSSRVFFCYRYEYLHIRNKEFPWGPDGLFEKKPEHH